MTVQRFTVRTLSGRRVQAAACFVASLFVSLALSVTAQQLRRFMVRDAIERTTFSLPDETGAEPSCLMSPDRQHFVCVTTRGSLVRNELTSSIWIYRADALRSYLSSRRTRGFPPQRLWALSGVPTAEQSHSYGSLITKVQWSSSSSALLFLAELPDGFRHLYRLRLSSRRPDAMSQNGQDVSDFSEANGTIAYVTLLKTQDKRTFRAKTPVSLDLTGQSLFHIFDPAAFPDGQSLYRPAALWVWRRSRLTCLSRENGNDWTYPVAARALLSIAVAPNGNGLIAARPVRRIAESWRNFRSYLPRFDLKQIQTPQGKPSLDWDWPWQFVYFDFRSGETWDMTSAPSSATAGYGGPVTALWSRDSRVAIVTNTFLESDSIDHRQHEGACAAAVSQVDRRKTFCLAYAPGPSERRKLRSVSLTSFGREASLLWSDGSAQRYPIPHDPEVHSSRREDEPGPLPDITLSLRQSLNDSPVLWVSSASVATAKPVWDPNPQMRSLQWGQASVYDWTGAAGYHWHAGLVLPPAYHPGQRYPLVIQTHGFRSDHYLVEGPYTTAFAAQALASKGMVVLQLEDRSDRHQVPPDQEAKLVAEGCIEAIQDLDRNGIIDPASVGIVGFSRSSWYVETALEMFPKAFSAAVIVDGIDQGYMSDMLFCPTLKSCQMDVQGSNGGPPFKAGLQQWLAQAASFHTDRIQAPVRIEAIRSYSLLQEWELYSCLVQQHKTVQLAYIPDGQHVLQQPQQRYASQQGTVEWLTTWLLRPRNAPSERSVR